MLGTLGNSTYVQLMFDRTNNNNGLNDSHYIEVIRAYDIIYLLTIILQRATFALYQILGFQNNNNCTRLNVTRCELIRWYDPFARLATEWSYDDNNNNKFLSFRQKQFTT